MSLAGKYGITAKTEPRADNPFFVGQRMPGTRHYEVSLYRGAEILTVAFSMGPKLERDPTADDVLSCLRDDAAMDDDPIGDFADFCFTAGVECPVDESEGGDIRGRYDEVCAELDRQQEGLRRLLGADYDEFLVYEDDPPVNGELTNRGGGV